MSEHSEITCRPPIVVLDTAARPGTSTPVHCSGRTKTTRVTFTQSGTATLVGPDHVSIAGRDVPAFHVREDMHMNGGQTGRTQIDTWFAESDALPLKETHSIEVVSPAPSPLNDVTYVERGHWRLTSLNPRR
jgi:hypothetical protein